MSKDACYYKIKAKYNVWPSARASQALAKCRKKNGNVRKTKAGMNLKRWEKEKWKNTKTGRSCGNSTDSVEYCRPTHKVSNKTPKMHPKNMKTNYMRKSKGMRANNSK